MLNERNIQNRGKLIIVQSSRPINKLLAFSVLWIKCCDGGTAAHRRHGGHHVLQPVLAAQRHDHTARHAIPPQAGSKTDHVV